MSELAAWLENLGLGKYAETFAEHEIDFEVLPELTEHDLEKLAIALGPRKKILKAIAALSAKAPGDTEAGMTAEAQREPTAAAPRSYTPKHLAEKILNSRSSLEGERKQVTLLFADIEDSTELIERLDAEQANNLLLPVLQDMMDAVHRFEGTVNKVQGDGIMAIFGAPIAHEDHAVRACYAALAMQEAVQKNAGQGGQEQPLIRIRVGLHSGEVVVRAIDNDLSMSYDALGMAVHLAARMEQLARAGCIYLTADTLKLAQGYIKTKPLGARPVKGLPEPVAVFELTASSGAQSRLQIARAQGLTPLVGRESELQLLRERFEQTRQGRGQMVFIVGEPGIGKSRLLDEFRQRLGNDATWLEGQTLSFGRRMMLHPLIDLLRRHFGIGDSDDAELVGAKIAQSVLRLDPALRPIIAYLRYLLAIDPGDTTVREMDPELRRAESFTALRRLLLAAAAARAQVVVLEDLHWIDRESEAFLRFIADSVPTSRVLCLFTYRPDYQQPFGERTYHTRIVLPALSARDTGRMARAALAAGQLPEALQTLIARKAEGNPFFVEEMIKSLQESGAIRRQGEAYALTRPLDQTLIPDTLHDVIMARIDRLAEAPKQTLQLAAAIGREFSRRLLDRLAEESGCSAAALETLKAVELIYEISLSPEPAYRFKHALTQEVAYHSLLASRRAALHRRIGLAIEEQHANHLAEHYQVIAHHFAQGEDWLKAFNYYCQAAQGAARAFATHEALSLYEQALDAAQRSKQAIDEKALIAAHLAKADLHFADSDYERSQAEAGRALALARQRGDAMSEGAALAKKGHASLCAHQFDQALSEANQAIAIAQTIAAGSVLAAGYTTTGVVYMVTGRVREGNHDFGLAIAAGEAIGDTSQQALALTNQGLIRNWSGRYRDAVHLSAKGLAIAREHHLLIPSLSGAQIHGNCLIGQGQYDEAHAVLTQGIALAGKAGVAVTRYRLLNTLGWLYSETGNLQRATVLNQQSADLSRQRGEPETLANAELNLADIFLARNDLTPAAELLDGIYRLVHNPKTSEWMKWRYSIHLFASLGECWLARGDAGKAEDFANQCLTLASSTDSRKYLVRGWRLKGSIALAKKQFDTAHGALSRAQAIAQQIKNPTQLWKTQLAMGRLLAAANERELARKAYRRARDVVDSMKAGIENQELQAGLEASPVFKDVYERSDA